VKFSADISNTSLHAYLTMSAAQTWSKFLSHSLATRLDPETFESYVQLLSTKHPLAPAHISDLFLRPSATNDGSLDPRIPRYMQVMLRLDLINISSILRALHKYSTFGTVLEEHEIDTQNKVIQADGEDTTRRKPEERRKRWANSYAAEELLFYQVAKSITSGSAPKDIQETVDLILVSIRWMALMTTAGNGANDMLNLGHAQAQEMSATTTALGTLMVAVVDNGRVVQALTKKNCPKGTIAQLSKALAGFIPLLMQSHPPTAGRLELFTTQTLVAIDPPEKKETASNAIDDILEDGMNLGMDSIVVTDEPSMNSRAGLYIYLNALVCQLVIQSEFTDRDSWWHGPS
jgi:mediator of RNA polymerase II transcription subunit 5